MHLSCNIGQRKLVKILIEAGADFKIKNKQLETPLDIAVKKQRKELIDIFSGKSAGATNGTHTKQTKNGSIIPHPTLSRDRRKKIRERLQASRDYGSNWQLLFQDWAPFGWVNPTPGTNTNSKCPHLYPTQTGYNPKVTSTTNGLQTLGKGEQYFVDLAGNVHKVSAFFGYFWRVFINNPLLNTV